MERHALKESSNIITSWGSNKLPAYDRKLVIGKKNYRRPGSAGPKDYFIFIISSPCGEPLLGTKT